MFRVKFAEHTPGYGPAIAVDKIQMSLLPDECPEGERCPKCGRPWHPWILGLHFGCSPKGWANCIRNERIQADKAERGD